MDISFCTNASVVSRVLDASMRLLMTSTMLLNHIWFFVPDCIQIYMRPRPLSAPGPSPHCVRVRLLCTLFAQLWLDMVIPSRKCFTLNLSWQNVYMRSTALQCGPSGSTPAYNHVAPCIISRSHFLSSSISRERSIIPIVLLGGSLKWLLNHIKSRDYYV